MVEGKPGKYVLNSLQSAAENIIKKLNRNVALVEMPPTSVLGKMADIAILNRKLKELYDDNDRVELLMLMDFALLPKSSYMELDGYTLKKVGYEILATTIQKMSMPDKQPNPDPNPNPSGAGDEDEDDEIETRFIKFDKQYASGVIGKGGHIVHELQSDSNTKICLSSWKDNGGNDHYGAFVTGLHRDIKIAKDLMSVKIEEAKSNRSINRGMRRAQVATGFSPVAKHQK